MLLINNSLNTYYFQELNGMGHQIIVAIMILISIGWTLATPEPFENPAMNPIYEQFLLKTYSCTCTSVYLRWGKAYQG